MSILNEASLVITPTAYKEDKLYSIIPKDDSGNLVWTRATDATRVNKDGYIETVPWNLIAQSNTFTLWSGLPSIVTANIEISPIGILNASLLYSPDTNPRNIYRTVNCVPSIYTMSFYVKKGTIGTTRNIAGGETNGGKSSSWRFNMDTKLFTLGSCTASYTELPNGWFRVLITIDVLVTSTFNTYIYGGGYYGGEGSCLWYGAQVTQGSTLKDYFHTTDRLDIPRLDYSNDDRPSILVEPQRTNLALRSEEFENAYWGKDNSTISSNSIISPDGTQDADSLIANGNSYAQIYKSYTLTSATTYTYSVFVKKSNYRYINLYTFQTRNGESANFYDFDTNSVNNTVVPSTPLSFVNYPNGWVRLSLTYTASAASQQFMITMCSSTGFNLITPPANSTVYLWGAQLEAGAYPTSYIPTVASTVTRVSDVASKTGISSLLNPSEGTLFIESSALSNDLTSKAIGIGDGTDSNYALIQYSSVGSNIIRFDVRNSLGVFRILISVDDITLNKKILLTWKDNSIFAFINGVKYTLTLVAGSGNGIPTALNRIDFGLYWGGLTFYSKTKLVAVWKTQLTDNQCIQLTTL